MNLLLPYFAISPYFWYAMFECFPSTEMQKTFVLQFVLGSHTIWLDYLASFCNWAGQFETPPPPKRGFLSHYMTRALCFMSKRNLEYKELIPIIKFSIFI